MRFQVPQFIEIEDKIFGPLTFKQFIYVAGGIGACVLLFSFLPKFIALLLSVPIFVFAMALAFYKSNSKPFIYTVEAFLKYSMSGKLYLWKKQERKETRNKKQETNQTQIQQITVPKLSESKLKELTWSLDIKENQNPVTPNQDESGSGNPNI
jgi:hypothetical protein